MRLFQALSEQAPQDMPHRTEAIHVPRLRQRVLRDIRTEASQCDPQPR